MRLYKGIIIACLMAAYGSVYGQVAKTITANKPAAATKNLKLYKDPEAPVNGRVENLLSQMTLDEKIGEMTQLCASSITLDGSKKLDLNTDKIRDYILKYHVGSFLSGTGKAQRWADFIGSIQNVAMKETRLGIPVIYGMDNVHGSDYTDEATFLPHNLNLSCSFNTDLAAEAAKITAIESATLGHHWNFAPVLDVGKNVWWPRLYETFGEDPLVCSRFGAEFTKAMQDTREVYPFKIAACAKHFIGYSDPKSGWDRTPSEIPDQVIREYFLPSFDAAFKAGIKTLMVNSGELNGEPLHTSKKWLTDVLRKEMKFEGVILTDIKDIMKVVEMHGGAADEKEATLLAINAGIDMSMACSDLNFIRYMKELVAEKKISEARINESVRRILKMKFELGLFDFTNPPTDAKSLHLDKIGSKEHYNKAVKSAEESIVLLKNEGSVLPFGSGIKKIAVAGFAANNKRNINGPWTLEWLGAPENRQPARMPILFESLKNAMPDKEVVLIDSISSFNESFENKAAGADAIVVTVGELPYSEFKGNVDRLDLDLAHQNLIKGALKLNKPVIVVFFGGRPRTWDDETNRMQALLFAGWPGIGGAEAIANLLCGKANPSAKLSFSWPKNQGHTIPYYHKKSEKYQPLYAFGTGLGYTSFKYDNLAISDTVVGLRTKLTGSVRVTNTGNVEGKEAVLWYLQDEVGRLTRPVKMLKHFEKISLKPGESKDLKFEIKPEKDFGYPNEKGTWILESGHHKLMVSDKSLRFRFTAKP